MPIERALRQVYPGRFHRASQYLADVVASGGPLAIGMSQQRLFSSFECNLVSAGTLTGNLPEVLRSLGQWYALRHELRGKIISGFAYPLAIYHLAVPLFGVINYFMGKAFEQELELRDVVIGVIAWSVLPWMIFFAFRLVWPRLQNSRVVGLMLSLTPVFGKLSFRLQGASFFQALSLCLRSGVGAEQSVRMAAASCSNKLFQRRYERMADVVATESVSFTKAFQRHQTFREASSPIPALLATGEKAGQLDDYAERIAKMLNQDASQQLTLIATLVPKGFYVVLMLFVGYKIIAFYSGMFSQIYGLL